MKLQETDNPRPIRVAMVCRYCPHWRAPMFARLNAEPDLEFAVFHGQTIPGTKIINAEHVEGFQHREHITLSGHLTAGGRTTPWVVFPTVVWSLIRYKPDVIIVEGGSNVFTNMFVYLYATLWRKPIVWWTLGELPGRQYHGIRKLYRRVADAMERGATALLGYSSVALAYFHRVGYPAERCFRAVNCVDTERILAEIEQQRDRVPLLRQKLGLDGKRVVLFVGALTAEKQIDRLLHAFVSIRGEVPSVHLLIVGDGPHRAQLQELGANLGLTADITFAGRVVENVSSYFELGDVFVMPGLGGLAVSEAMTHGMPVICSQGDGCEVDLVRNGETGYRFGRLEDTDAISLISEKVISILSDENRLRSMRAAARRVIEEEHNVNTYIAHVADALRYAGTGVRTTPIVDSPLQPSAENSPPGH